MAWYHDHEIDWFHIKHMNISTAVLRCIKAVNLTHSRSGSPTPSLRCHLFHYLYIKFAYLWKWLVAEFFNWLQYSWILGIYLLCHSQRIPDEQSISLVFAIWGKLWIKESNANAKLLLLPALRHCVIPYWLCWSIFALERCSMIILQIELMRCMWHSCLVSRWTLANLWFFYRATAERSVISMS